jgi:Arc/MetJ-type ribon-helix-helix transcriptional regulator
MAPRRLGAPWAGQCKAVDTVSQTRYIDAMKTATIPPIRIEPAFREEIEQALDAGETMAAMVETAVRTEVARRRDQSEFVRRGLASIARSEAAGDWIPAETVIAKLQAKVAAARERQKKHQQ